MIEITLQDSHSVVAAIYAEKVCGVSLRSSDACFAIVHRAEDGTIAFEQRATKKLTVGDDKDADALRNFKQSAETFVRENAIEALVRKVPPWDVVDGIPTLSGSTPARIIVGGDHFGVEKRKGGDWRRSTSAPSMRDAVKAAEEVCR